MSFGFIYLLLPFPIPRCALIDQHGILTSKLPTMWTVLFVVLVSYFFMLINFPLHVSLHRVSL